MVEQMKLCGCIPLRWAAILAEIVIMSVSIVILVLIGLHSTSIVLNSTMTTYIIHLIVYAPIIAFTSVGIAAIGQRDGRRLASTLKWIYINIFIIVIVEVISIIFIATSRKSTIITECQLKHLDNLSTMDYLTNSIYALVEVNAVCNQYWTNIILVYTIGLISFLIIMILSIFVVRLHLSELQSASEAYVSGMNETMQDEDYEEYKPMVSDFKHHSYKQDPTEDTNRDLYDSRSTLYSKIYQKNILRQKDAIKQSLGSLHPPEYSPQPNIKSPTLERMEYSQFKEHGAGNVPLEREGMNTPSGEQFPPNASDPPNESDPPEAKGDPESDRLLRR